MVNIQGGASFLRLQYLNRSDYSGSMSFNVDYTTINFGDALAGLVDGVHVQNRLSQGGIQHNGFFYLQDDWRILAASPQHGLIAVPCG